MTTDDRPRQSPPDEGPDPGSAREAAGARDAMDTRSSPHRSSGGEVDRTHGEAAQWLEAALAADVGDPAPEERVEIAGSADDTRSSTDLERDRIVAEALAHAEARDARYRTPIEKPVGRWRGAMGLAVLALATLVLAAPPSWLWGSAPPEVPATVRETGVRTVLHLQAAELEAFRLRRERLPRSLAEVTALPGVEWIRSSERVYQLVAYGPDGRARVLDGQRPDPRLTRIAEAWLAGVDRR